jgi:hypothetical protein
MAFLLPKLSAKNVGPDRMSLTAASRNTPATTGTREWRVADSNCFTPHPLMSSADKAAYDAEQERLMEEVCIVIDPFDKALGEGSKRKCALRIPRIHFFFPSA